MGLFLKRCLNLAFVPSVKSRTLNPAARSASCSATQQEGKLEFQRQMVRLTLDVFGELLQRSCQRGTPNVKHQSLKFKPL